MIDNDFLPLFRNQGLRAIDSSFTGVEPSSDVFFCLRQNAQEWGTVFVDVVDKSGKNVNPSSSGQAGDVATVLRMLEQIREQQQMQISWGMEEGVRLHEHPYLLLALLRCPNLVDQQMQPLHVQEVDAHIQLALSLSQEKYHPQYHVDWEENGNRHSESFVPLNDCFVITQNHCIIPVPSLGGNYRHLPFFTTPFPMDMLERWLSVFYSYVTNVRLNLENYELIWADEPLSAVPTVVIEKVDSDMALCLRLTESIPDMDMDFVEQFSPTVVARVTDNRLVFLRHIRPLDRDAAAANLSRIILRFAPSRAAAREVWQDSEGHFIVPPETAQPFLLKGLPDVVVHFHLMGTDRLREYKVVPLKPRLSLSLGSGIDFLEGTASVSLGNEQLSLAEFLRQYQRNHYIQLTDGNRAIIDEGYVRRLERLFHRAEKGGRVRVSFFDLPEVEALLDERLEGEAFKHHRSFYEGFNALAEQRLRISGVKATLRPYQREGVKWINYLYDNGFGGCLADDMGLGKTLQTIAMLARIYPREKTPSLIVMPRSLLFNWQDELRKFAPQLTYTIYYGTARNLDEACRSQLVLTTYALVRNDIEQLRQRPFHYVILDESQNVKNVQSQASQAVCLLQASHRLALSGTPIENNLIELYSLFRFLNPAMFGSAQDFNQRYALPIQRDGDAEVTESLRRRIFPFILRRLKRDVLAELPDRMDQTLYVEMEEDQARLYEQRRQYYQQAISASISSQGLERSQMLMFQALSELRRIASVPESLTDGRIASPKVERLLEALSEAVEGGHKVVVFFNFIAGLELVGERLNELGIDFATMTGSTHDRRAVVTRFQEDSACRVLLMTLKTGGVGLNLTAADTVFIFEPWWNRAAEEQAINRLHRIGQMTKVMSYALIVRETIEEKIRLLQEQKTALTDALISSDIQGKRLSEEDIKFILGN